MELGHDYSGFHSTSSTKDISMLYINYDGTICALHWLGGCPFCNTTTSTPDKCLANHTNVTYSRSGPSASSLFCSFHFGSFFTITPVSMF